MSKIDLQDAYYLIPIKKVDRKYLRFRYKGVFYQFNCLPFGLCTAPRVYTTILKPVLSVLRSNRCNIVGYLDDLLLLDKDQCTLASKCSETLKLLNILGLPINHKKSEPNPCQKIEYLGFVFDSLQMTISLPNRKVINIIRVLKSTLLKKMVTIQALAELLGSLVSLTPAVAYSMLYTRQLEVEKPTPSRSL